MKLAHRLSRKILRDGRWRSPTATVAMATAALIATLLAMPAAEAASTGQMVGDQVTFSGTARTHHKPWQKIAFTVNATGNANPGTQDTFSITVDGTYSANSQLTSGSIQIR